VDATLGLPLLVGLIAVALLFDFLNGLHDAANSIATIVSTRVLRPQYAVFWAAFFNFVAFLVFGLNVAQTIGTGIVEPSIIDAQVIFAALMGLFLEFAVFRWVRTREPVVKAVITEAPGRRGLEGSGRLPPMSIWRTQTSVEQLQVHSRNTLADTIGIRVTEIGPDYVRATMPVSPRTHQPMGVLHGGASVALAETVGSLAANMCVDQTLYVCLGQEINANHLRPVSSGIVTATARPYHIGKRTHVWGIEIRDEQEKLVCVSRLTLAVRRPKGAVVCFGAVVAMKSLLNYT